MFACRSVTIIVFCALMCCAYLNTATSECPKSAKLIFLEMPVSILIGMLSMRNMPNVAYTNHTTNSTPKTSKKKKKTLLERKIEYACVCVR